MHLVWQMISPRIAHRPHSADLIGPPQQYTVLATLSSIGGKELRGYKYVVPEWCEEPSDPSLRDVEVCTLMLQAEWFSHT